MREAIAGKQLFREQMDFLFQRAGETFAIPNDRAFAFFVFEKSDECGRRFSVTHDILAMANGEGGSNNLKKFLQENSCGSRHGDAKGYRKNDELQSFMGDLRACFSGVKLPALKKGEQRQNEITRKENTRKRKDCCDAEGKKRAKTEAEREIVS